MEKSKNKCLCPNCQEKSGPTAFQHTDIDKSKFCKGEATELDPDIFKPENVTRESVIKLDQ